MVARFSVDDRNLKRRLARIQRDIATNGMATVKQVSQIMALRASMLAPKDTGELRRFIKIIPVNKKDNQECIVGYENGGMGVGNPHPDRRYNGMEFSLPLWMHSPGSGAFNHPWRSGGPMFLPRAAKATRAEFNDRIRKVVQQALQYKTK